MQIKHKQYFFLGEFNFYFVSKFQYPVWCKKYMNVCHSITHDMLIFGSLSLRSLLVFGVFN